MQFFIIFFTILSVVYINSCFSPNSDSIERIRKRVAENEKYYSVADVERVKTSNDLIKAVSGVTEDEAEAIKQIDTTFKWRKTNIHPDFTDTSFPLEIYKTAWHTYLGTDQGNVVMLITFANWRRGSSKFERLYEEYILYTIEKYVDASKKSLILISDASNLGTSSIDLTLFMFICNTAGKYYSHINLQVFTINFHPQLKSMADTMLSLSGKFGTSVKFIKQEELFKYVDKSIIPIHLKGDNPVQLNAVPAGCKPLEYFDRVKFTPAEVKEVYQLFNGFK